MARLSPGRWAPLVLAGWGVCGAAVFGQLPTARLDALAPRGGQAGAAVDVTLVGADLDDVRELRFSHPGLTATHVEGGRFKVEVAAGVPPGRHEVRANGRYGVSTGAVFVVGSLPEVMEPSGNHARESAAPVPFPVTVNGVADADASDYFKVTVVRGRPVHLDCAAQRLDSPLNAVISVRDPSGVEVHRASRTLDRDPVSVFVPSVDGEHTVEVHDATWRGGPAFAYRLTLATEPVSPELPVPVPLAGEFLPAGSAAAVAESEPNDTAADAQRLAGPGEVVGTLDRDWFSFTSETARPLVVEVASHRLGVPSDPVLVVHTVTRDASGAEVMAQVAGFEDTPGPPGGERFRLGSRDPVGRLNAEAGVTYRFFVTDRFNTGGRYRLLVRDPQPDFQVLVMPESPASDAKALMRWTPMLRRQSTTALSVVVVRLDGHDEAVTVKADHLPPGVSMAECRIPPGHAAGLVVLRAAADAPAWTGPLTLSGHAGDAVRTVREVAPRWSVGDAGAERVDLRVVEFGPMLAVTEDGGVPLEVEAAAPAVIETSLGATLEVPVKFLRAPSHKGFKGEWEAGLSGLPGQRLWQPAKPAADAAEATLAVALVKKDGNQFVPGTWTVYAATRGTVQWQPDEKTPVRDVRDAAYSAPIQVRIEPSPVALTAPETAVLARGGMASVAVRLDRRFGFAEGAELTLRLPDGLQGVTAPAVAVAKEAADAALAVAASADAPSGRHAAVLEAKCQWNGEELISRRDILIEITP